jgi:hypothetical protein
MITNEQFLPPPIAVPSPGRLHQISRVIRVIARALAWCTTQWRPQAVARRHRDDPRDPKGRRSARHLDPRPSRDRPQGARELPEPGAALVVEPQQVVLGQADSLLIVAPQAPWNDVTVKLVCCVAGTSPEAEREPRSCQATPQVQQGRKVARTPLRH